MGVVVVNAFIHVTDRLLGKFQSLCAMSTFIGLSSLQFLRGCRQVTKGFLHMWLILTKSESRHQQDQRHD